MKTHPPTPNGWIAYVESIKSVLKRELTKKEVSLMIDSYIHSVSHEEAVKLLKKEK